MPETNPTTQQTPEQATASKIRDTVELIKINAGSRGSVKAYMGDILAQLACPQEVRTFIAADSAYSQDASGKTKDQIQKNKAATPSYNVRTPYFNLELNGIQIFESPLGGQIEYETEKRKIYKEYNSSFKSLTLTAPLGGEVGTIQGHLELFTKDPVTFINSIFYPKSEDSEAYGGMPIATLKFGWTVATGIPGVDNEDGVKQLVSNPVKLMVTDFGISDASSLGVTVKLQLMDTGSTLTKNSAGCLGVQADYPQEQLRFILEKLIKVRLFTLDDFYYFNDMNGTASSKDAPKQTSGTAESKTTFVNPVNKPMRLNGNLIHYAVEHLVSIIRERFSFYSNKDFTSTVEKGTQVNKDFAEAKKALEELNDALNEGRKEGSAEDYKQLEELQKKMSESQEALVYSTNLVWVPTIPVGWKTSSGYAGEPNEAGAYVLLPDPTTLLDVDSTSLPIIFGPGASSYPYLFASGQNIVNYQENPSATWGDVMAISVDYSSLMAQMLADTSEVQSYASDLERQSSYKGKLDKTKQSTKTSGTVMRTWERPPGMPPAEERASKEKGKIDRTEWRPVNSGLRFRGSVHGRSSNKSDDPELSTKSFSDKEAAKYRSSDNMTKEASSNAMLNLKAKVSTFLNWPHNISITVLGDPSLMHQGAGLFELVAYYPVETLEGTSVDHTFNHFLSGLYMVTDVTHNLSAGNFTTELKGTLVPTLLAIGDKNKDGEDAWSKYGIVNAIDSAATTKSNEAAFAGLQKVSAESLGEQAKDETFNKILAMYKTQKRPENT